VNKKTSLLACVSLVGIILATNSASQLTVNIPIEKVIDAIVDGGKYVIDYIKFNNGQKRADSVGQLVIDLATLAGLEEALANQIDLLAKDPNSAHDDPNDASGSGGAVLISLNNNLELVKQQFENVDNALLI
jgi:hypothetical protein